jgi:hypothetical protein
VTANPYGPDQPCQRTTCNHDDNHLGGAHLNPYDRAHYDGIVTLYSAMPATVRTAAMPILLHVGAFGPVDPDSGDDARRAVETALTAAFEEIDRLRQQVAHVRVDADHKIRDAMARAVDCADHGRVITELETQLTASDRAHDLAEKARLALLGGHLALGDLLTAAAKSDTPPNPVALVVALTALYKRTAAAHTRAWK